MSDPYAGRFETGWRRKSGTDEVEQVGFVCPMCSTQTMHSRTEHRRLVQAIRYPLDVQLWSFDDGDSLTPVSRGHQPPRRFLAAADQLEELHDGELPGEDGVRHVWMRYVHIRGFESDEPGQWRQCDRGRGAVPYTLADLLEPPFEDDDQPVGPFGAGRQEVIA